MGDFFRGWRRKLGVATLVMACVAMGGWVRSLGINDYASRSANHTSETVFSMDGSIGWSHTYHDEIVNADLSWRSSVDILGASSEPTFWWYSSGFAIFVSPTEWIMGVPYWSIVIPLTLISAYLLLTKPRKSTPIKVVEPISTEGK